VNRAVLLLPFLLVAAGNGDDADLFERRVRPVLVETCFKCHGGTKTSGDLRVDTLEALLKGGKSGAAIVPGKPEGSLLMRAIRHEADDFKMPPKAKLPKETIDAFAKWIAAGAPWPKAAKPAPESAGKHWAFQPVRKPAEGSIDQILRKSREKAGVKTVPPADRRTLVRRAYFDLVGLPPEPERVESFAKDERPDAFARLVDELLASPRYGERWGRHWLDLARYADTAGDDSDYPVPQAHLYRDYVIDAFNRDLPYDQFVVEQLAGDQLARRQPDERFEEKIVATGFLALARRFNNSKYGDMHLVVENTIDTIGKAFLGMSVACARCHDHKFDPISREDYYGLYGYFASTQYPHNGTEHGRGHDNLVPLTKDPELFEKARAWMNRWHEAYYAWRKDNKAGAKEKFEAVKKERPDVR
jgi:cytochrome c553